MLLNLPPRTGQPPPPSLCPRLLSQIITWPQMSPVRRLSGPGPPLTPAASSPPGPGQFSRDFARAWRFQTSARRQLRSILTTSHLLLPVTQIRCCCCRRCHHMKQECRRANSLSSCSARQSMHTSLPDGGRRYPRASPAG